MILRWFQLPLSLQVSLLFLHSTLAAFLLQGIINIIIIAVATAAITQPARYLNLEQEHDQIVTTAPSCYINLFTVDLRLMSVVHTTRPALDLRSKRVPEKVDVN
jgi:hypothetical protein